MFSPISQHSFFQEVIMALPVAIQLYSVRDALEADFEGTLRAIKAMGYDGVEFAGLCGNDPAYVKALVEEIGLVPISAHIPTTEFINCGGVDKVLDMYKSVGVKYVALPYLLEDRWPGSEGWTETHALMMYIGICAAKRGMKLLYHNHDFEFKNKIDGRYMLEYMYDSIPAEYLASELDTCWVNIGGENPADYIRKFTGRAPVVHIKDFFYSGKLPKRLYDLIGIDEEDVEEEEGSFEFRPAGHGMQDVPAILAASVDAGAEWVVFEQDNPSEGMTPMECAEKAVTFIKGCEW